MKNSIVLALLFIVGSLIYSNSLHGEFVGDDYYWFVNHHEIKNIANLTDILIFYRARFIFGLSIAFNYWLGGFNVVGYHVFNVCVHVFTSFLVYHLVRITFRTPYFKSKKNAGGDKPIAIFAALIFLCHPIQTQAVSFVAQRMTSMATCFYLLTLILFIRSKLEKNPLLYKISLFVMILGLLTKELMATLVVMLFVYELFFFKTKKEDIKRNLKTLAPFMIVTCLVPLVYSLRGAVTPGRMNHFLGLERFDWNYVFTEINVFRTYLRMFVFPINLNHDYDYPIAQGLFEVPTILSLCLLIGLGVIAKKTYQKHRLISFCICWFFITTSVEATAVIFGNRNVIYDHWLYLPMVGYAIFLTLICHGIAKDKQGSRGLLITILLIFSMMTYQRNKVWETEIGFWKDVIEKSPKKAGPYLAMAKAYQRKGLNKKAYEHYKKALERNSNYHKAYTNIAILEFNQGDKQKAISSLNKALKIDPFNAKASNNLGYIYFLEGEHQKAIEQYTKSIQVQGDYGDAYYYIGRSQLALNKRHQAKESLKKAVDLYKRRYNQKGVQLAQELLSQMN